VPIPIKIPINIHNNSNRYAGQYFQKPAAPTHYQTSRGGGMPSPFFMPGMAKINTTHRI